jgi:hypothetical protein
VPGRLGNRKAANDEAAAKELRKLNDPIDVSGDGVDRNPALRVVRYRIPVGDRRTSPPAGLNPQSNWPAIARAEGQP